MYTTSGRSGFDIQMPSLLSDLCFLHEREHNHDLVHKRLRGYGKLVVVGPFQALFGKHGNYVAEVASV